MSWSKTSRAKVGAAAFERFAKPVTALPARHHPLRVARVAAGYTQAELGAAAHVHSTLISRIERGVVAGSSPSQIKLADALGKSRQELFGLLPDINVMAARRA